MNLNKNNCIFMRFIDIMVLTNLFIYSPFFLVLLS
ncbi:LOW QUALITY PROTEIN: hypothetical protein TorRG33x02_062090 [Trema orientale]|uniref:Uncharacterized protein n=1 Tax=Trema orientale TaxID=63057 RepID=A0A2P5FJD9_TREOI|nr:LOW QUALITY PROTEIN: hypothetical protein TorRG33x02_062090 [Trema orientale]